MIVNIQIMQFGSVALLEFLNEIEIKDEMKW